jgi:hypothetical protein
MVYMKDQRFSPREGENKYAVAMRDYIESTKPYRDSSVMFAAYSPPGENAMSSWAPMLLTAALIGFLIL